MSSPATRAVGPVPTLTVNEARYLRRRVRYLIEKRTSPPSGYAKFGLSLERAQEINTFADTFIEEDGE